MLSALNPNPLLHTPRDIDDAIGPPKPARTPEKDLHLWPPVIAALVAEKKTPQKSLVLVAQSKKQKSAQSRHKRAKGKDL